MRIRHQLATYVVMATIFAAAAEAQPPLGCRNILDQGGFEDTGGWTTVPGPGLTTGLPERQSAAGPADEGQLYLEVASSGPTWVRQAVQTKSGARYLLGFAYRPRSGYDSSVDVYWNNNKIAELLRPGNTVSTWRDFEVVVTGTGNDQVDFRDVSATTPRLQALGGALIDDAYLCRIGPGLSSQTCCDANPIVWTADRHFYLLDEKGLVVRAFWRNGWQKEFVDTTSVSAPIVRGSLIARGSGHFAGVSEDNMVVISQDNGTGIEVVPVNGAGRVYPCSLILSEKYGIFAVDFTNRLLRIYPDNNQWIVEKIDTYGADIVPMASTHMADGRIGGLNEDGELWNLWWDADNGKLQFNTIPEAGSGFVP